MRANTPGVHRIVQKKKLQGYSHPSRKTALPGHDRLKKRDSAQPPRQLLVLGFRPVRPTSFPYCTLREALGARMRALCRCTTRCEGWLQMIARSESSAVLKRMLTYRIATLQTHCKSLALKNQAGGVVGKCRQLKIRFARHFGQARGLARRNEKSPCCL